LENREHASAHALTISEEKAGCRDLNTEIADGAIFYMPLATISALLMLELLSQCSHRLGVLQNLENEGQVHVRFGGLAWGEE